MGPPPMRIYSRKHSKKTEPCRPDILFSKYHTQIDRSENGIENILPFGISVHIRKKCSKQTKSNKSGPEQRVENKPTEQDTPHQSHNGEKESARKMSLVSRHADTSEPYQSARFFGVQTLRMMKFRASL